MHFLHQLASDLGANLRYGTRVVNVNLETKSVTLENGEVIQGDIIVGADGSEGTTRPVFEPNDDEPLVNVYR